MSVATRKLATSPQMQHTGKRGFAFVWGLMLAFIHLFLPTFALEGPTVELDGAAETTTVTTPPLGHGASGERIGATARGAATADDVALLAAAARGNIATAEALLSAGASPDAATDPKSRMTALNQGQQCCSLAAILFRRRLLIRSHCPFHSLHARRP